jgi:hypothetical protein
MKEATADTERVASFFYYYKNFTKVPPTGNVLFNLENSDYIIKPVKIVKKQGGCQCERSLHKMLFLRVNLTAFI